MIVVADKMKKPVDDHAVKLIIKFGSELDGILPHAVNADEKITGKPVALALVEGNDIGEIVMMQVAKIHIKNVII